MTRTVMLDGSEQMVECTGGRNMMIINKSDSPVYASRNQNIIPYEDDVMEIDAGSMDTVEGANGVVYLSGTGRVEVRGVDYVGFKKPSSSSGNGGGGGGIPTELMPVMLGIEAVYTKNGLKKNCLVNEIGIEPIVFSDDVKISDDGVNIPYNIRGVVNTERGNESPRTIYVVLKALAESNCACLLTKAVSYNSAGYGFNILSDMATKRGIFISSMTHNLKTPLPNNPLEYAVVALSADYSTNSLKGFINGVRLVRQNNGDDNIPCYSSNYKGHFLINEEDMNGNSYDEPVGCNIAFLAFGFETHTDEQMLENSEWLMEKYCVGKGEDSLMPYTSNTQGYFVPQTRQISNGLWKNIFNGDIDLINAVENEEAVRFGPSAYGVYALVDHPKTVYCVFRFLTDPSSETLAWYPVITKGLNASSGITRCGFDLFVQTGESSPPRVAFSGISADVVSSIIPEEYVVCAYSRNNDDTVSIFINGNLIGTSGYTYTRAFAGKMYLNTTVRGNTIPENNSLGEIDMLMCAFSSISHTSEQIKANSEWLMKKYLT